MSREARDWVYRVMERGLVPLSSLAVLFALADHHNPKHGCFPFQKKLCERLGISQRTLQHHLKILKQAGLIRVIRRRRGVGYALLMEDPEQDHDTCNILHVKNPSDGGNILPVQGATYCTSTPGNQEVTGNILHIHLNPVTPDSENPVTDLFCIRKTDVPSGEKIPESEKEEKTPEPGQEPPTVKTEELLAKKMQPKTEAEVLAKVEKARKSPKGITPAVLGHLWRDLHVLYLPEYTMAGMTHVQLKQLAHAYATAGGDFVPTLVALLKDWHSFRMYCKALNVFPLAKPMPEVGFVLKNIQIAVLFYRERLLVQSDAYTAGPPSPKATKKVAKPVTEDAPVVKDTPATLEEVQAILNGTYHGT